MNASVTVNDIDWRPILNRIQRRNDRELPMYPGDLKTALLQHAQLSDHPKAEAVYQLASELACLTTPCDPEIVYWFSRLLALLDAQ